MRKYTLITGATGLLGAYLLRNLLACGEPCAVLVRSSRMETASQRIETLLTRMEREIGTMLPRPVVLEGTLSENFGLNAENIDWVRRHCGRLLHNAASLIFEQDAKTGEPYRSNVTGTEHAIEFALRCGIPQFHHVSTAYVCGLRTGLCRENELDVGQDWGNDYEKAKVIAEKKVRAASFAEPPTFYRPAIITGDSVTGYTSTYHGFYTPLKVAASLVSDQNFSGTGDDIIHFLNMKGEEHKNFVPVEWIAQAIVALMIRPASVGMTFHLTPQNRVTVGEMYTIFTEALKQYGKRHVENVSPRQNSGKSISPEMFNNLMTSFRDQMRVYRSYWRDDPVFDTSNTDAALPDLPCPIMTTDVLMRLSMFALETNFGWPKSQPIVPPFFVRDVLPVHPVFHPTTETADNIVLSVYGPGGGDWTLSVQQGRSVFAEEGNNVQAVGRLRLSSVLFDSLRQGTLSPQQAVDSGAVVWESNGESNSKSRLQTNGTDIARILSTLTLRNNGV